MEPERRDAENEPGVVEKAQEEAELAKTGEAEHTPLVALGGLTVVLGLVVGAVIVVGLLVWWLA